MSRSELTAIAAGAAVGAAVVIVWKRSTAVRPAPAVAEPPRYAAQPPPAPTSSIMESELERLARVAIGHGPDDPAVDVFLAFVGALDPLPAAAALAPAAQVIGTPRLEQALDRPGESHVGARRLLAAASVATPRVVPAVDAARVVTIDRPAGAERRVPELFEALLHAIRSGLSLFA